MTLHDVLSTPPPARVAALGRRRRTLAIVSTRNRLCGIAAYTAALERHLAELFDVTVFDLDQYLLRSTHRRIRRIGDRHIKAIGRELHNFDAVNLQVEYGTLGRLAGDVLRRFGWLVDAAPRLSATLHTMIPPPAFPRADLARAVFAGRWRDAEGHWSSFRRDGRLSLGIARRLRRAQRHKPVSVIVHNRRDSRDARYLHGLDNVFDHPLTFLSEDEVSDIIERASPWRFPQLDRLPDQTVLIGVFGFLDAYKGFGTAIRALHHLPPTHHLLIFGGVHPNAIAAHRPVHPYLASLFEEAFVDTSLYERIGGTANGGSPALSFGSDRYLADLLGAHPRDLSERIHFMGALDDDDFLAGMAICDAIVLPYLEVGQSASGPISQALELGRRVIASRTHAFLEFAAYHPHSVEFFDIGNHLELAERVLARPQHAARQGAPAFNVETNRAVYFAANGTTHDTEANWFRSLGGAVSAALPARRAERS